MPLDIFQSRIGAPVDINSLCVQVVAYIEERKELLARQERDIPSEMQRTRQLQRQNSEVRWGQSYFFHRDIVGSMLI